MSKAIDKFFHTCLSLVLKVATIASKNLIKEVKSDKLREIYKNTVCIDEKIYDELCLAHDINIPGYKSNEINRVEPDTLETP